MRRGSLLVACLATAMLGLVGCSGGGSSTSARLTVSPDRALYDTPVAVTVSGLKPGSAVTLRASSVDTQGTTWSSSAMFAASSGGAMSTAQAPTGGSYTGPNPMGLFETLAPAGSPTPQAILTPPHNWQIRVVAVVNGKTVATSTITRLLALQTGAVEKDLRPPADPIYGDLFLPADISRRHPAVLVFGGSEGGLSGTVQAATLAAHGYPALALAYFHEPGLPQDLQRIPLEYLATAARLLATQPGVDAAHLMVWGWSRGSEAAQLLGADFPTLVHGVIATVPSADPDRPPATSPNRPGRSPDGPCRSSTTNW